MSGFTMPEWRTMFVPELSLLESFLRGTIIYLSIIVLFRVVPKRHVGSLGLPDIMLVVLMTECVTGALSAETKSIPNSLVAVSALLFWSYTLERFGRRWPWFHRLLEPRPVELIRDGKILDENMEREDIAEDELMTQLRENQIDDPDRVKAAVLESDGKISVIPRDHANGQHPPLPPAPASLAGTLPDYQATYERFLAAAGELRAVIDWHQKQAADHQAAAKAAREVLTRQGVRVSRAARRPPPAPPTEAPQ
jgi:uncharacterized membrane protein YcaP (DUF421 family)